MGMGCQSTGKQAADGNAGAASAKVQIVKLDLSKAPPKPGSRFASSAVWRRARSHDELDLQRLAEHESAAGLIEALEQGHSVARTALLAMPYAPDAELVLEPLCAGLLRVSVSERSLILKALHGVLANPPEQRERVSTEPSECSGVLKQIEPAAKGEQRDLVSSIRALLPTWYRQGRAPKAGEPNAKLASPAAGAGDQGAGAPSKTP